MASLYRKPTSVHSGPPLAIGYGAASDGIASVSFSADQLAIDLLPGAAQVTAAGVAWDDLGTAALAWHMGVRLMALASVAADGECVPVSSGVRVAGRAPRLPRQQPALVADADLAPRREVGRDQWPEQHPSSVEPCHGGGIVLRALRAEFRRGGR